MGLTKEALTTALHGIEPQVRWVCEAMIPRDPAGLLPSALDVGVPERLLPRALALRDDWAPAFITALASLPAAPPAEPLAAIRALAPGLYYVVGQLIAGAYFMDPVVRAELRYPGQQALHEQVDYDEIMAAVERVQARGPVYRDPRASA